MQHRFRWIWRYIMIYYYDYYYWTVLITYRSLTENNHKNYPTHCKYFGFHQFLEIIVTVSRDVPPTHPERALNSMAAPWRQHETCELAVLVIIIQDVIQDVVIIQDCNTSFVISNNLFVVSLFLSGNVICTNIRVCLHNGKVSSRCTFGFGIIRWF